MRKHGTFGAKCNSTAIEIIQEIANPFSDLIILFCWEDSRGGCWGDEESLKTVFNVVSSTADIELDCGVHVKACAFNVTLC